MTTLIKIAVIAVTLFVSVVSAQNFQGVATYKTQRNMDIKLDSTRITPEMQKRMMEMMKKQFQRTYHLTFSKEASTYKQEEQLDKPQIGGGDMQIMVVGNGGGEDVLYKNTKNNTYADQRDTFGKIFLVKDEIENIDWKLTSETKHIGEYEVYKATYEREVPAERSFSSSSNKEIDLDEEPEKVKRTVTAWYAPQIPVSNGPGMYQGLPGLILEVHDGRMHIVCSKIVLNPKEEIEIKAPTKGKEVTQEKYETIMEKKAKEMMERYAPRNGRDGEEIQIRIGG